MGEFSNLYCTRWNYFSLRWNQPSKIEHSLLGSRISGWAFDAFKNAQEQADAIKSLPGLTPKKDEKA